MNHQNNRDHHLLNYIRVHRRNAGITQAELGQALGYRNAETVARHERFAAIPPLEVAISYEIVFRVPIAEMFAGLRADVEARVETSSSELGEQLGERSMRDANAHAIARKLIWLRGRKDANTELLA